MHVSIRCFEKLAGWLPLVLACLKPTRNHGQFGSRFAFGGIPDRKEIAKRSPFANQVIEGFCTVVKL